MLFSIKICLMLFNIMLTIQLALILEEWSLLAMDNNQVGHQRSKKAKYSLKHFAQECLLC